ncbi:MAG: tetratricopeptide repeat protein [Acidobacteria bacterium]|nr:tetratricopeptide repeat protein [Acidobacteriota bacterium]
MAHASGLADENFVPADFTHAESGVHYRIYRENGRDWLSFDRQSRDPVHGKRELLYYIGSGRRGLTYLFADDGFLFELPINWYGNKRLWDMTPAYLDAHEIPLNLPAHTNCLHCHVSGMRPPLDGTENDYEMPVLSGSGISCERCHGPGATHLRSGAIVNPSKLSPQARDAVCMQCHMEGRVSVERPGRHVYEFRPGDSLADFIRYYVTPASLRLGAVSQVEALAQSVCKKKSGDTMSCTSCHDPHSSPSREARVIYFRQKCLTCHGPDFGSKHHPEQTDCTACHMPASPSTNIAHTQVTDHRIPRLPSVEMPRLDKARASPDKVELVPFPDSREADDDVRDLALAWEQLANSGEENARARAEEMLERSASLVPDDPETLSALGYEQQRSGKIAAARKSYQRALALHPDLIDAATNLGVIEAQSGRLESAISLWSSAFARAPGRSSVGINLARAYCLAGRPDAARVSISRILEFNPDMSAARRMLEHLSRTGASCDPN